jgi:hypothetical protein
VGETSPTSVTAFPQPGPKANLTKRPIRAVPGDAHSPARPNWQASGAGFKKYVLLKPGWRKMSPEFNPSFSKMD